MNHLPWKLILFLVLFFSLATYYILNTEYSFAADAVPAPAPIPCKDTKNPEFSSDRPYQASPCGESPESTVSYWCGNGVVISLGTVKVPYCDSRAGEKRSCPVDITKDQKIDVDLTNVELPILGNTQDTKNSVSATDNIDDGTKVSNYVSWYLGGVNGRAEYGSTDLNVDFSGPLKKLLPSIVQDATRIQTISAASKPADNPENHNQIVVCANHDGSGFWAGVQDLLGLGKYNATGCYTGGGAKAKGDLVMRLKDWNAKLGANVVINTVIQSAIRGLKLVYPFIPDGAIEESIGKHWELARPPLPWSDKEGKPFSSEAEYQKAYYEWKGNICAIIPIIDRVVCFANVFVPTKYADLYQYVPLANTTDKSGSQTATDALVSASSGTIDKQSSVISHSPQLFLAHTLEDYQLSNSLKSTYKPKKGTGGIPSDVERNGECRIVPSRTNSGDAATFSNIKSHIEVDVNYHISQIRCTNFGYDDKNGAYTADCTSDISATINSVGKTPYADEIWSNTVAGGDSIFRRIYPKTGAGSPVSCIADTPASSNANYTLTGNSSAGVGLSGVSEPDRSVVSGDGQSVDAQLYYPHLGGVLDYFLKGIQQALRPQGYGEGTPENGQFCSNVACGDLPGGLPKASGSCSLGSTGRVTIPNSFKVILGAAAQTYKVPPGLILGVMFGEGAFEGRYNWTDTNVKNWASCERLPNCSPGGSTINSIVPFVGSNWTRLAGRILPDLRKIDPAKNRADPCNLLDATFALAKDLSTNKNGGGFGGLTSCLKIPLNTGSSKTNGCAWSPSDYETAIKVWENGFEPSCFTKEGSCATGGGEAAACPTGGDSCETLTNRYSRASHNACVWDVAHGQ